uniref:BLUF domain-containing protein n=1 Tax=Anolis carolinensis TaxID=28377 RepID=A0A803TW71_ANOCA
MAETWEAFHVPPGTMGGNQAINTLPSPWDGELEYWEQLFVKLQHSYFQSEGITGLLLLYPTCIVHILESSSDVLYNILRDLRNMEQQQRVLILDAKILIMSHNLPSRLFQQWHYKVLNVPERRLDYDTSQEESAETLTHECLTALLKIGKHLLKYPKSPKNLPDTILEKVPDLIIPQDTICYLLTCQELLSPAQYLQFFDSPLNIQMDSGIGQIVERTVRDGEKVRC